MRIIEAKRDQFVDQDILREIDKISKKMMGPRQTKITKMSSGHYCIRIEKRYPNEKLKLDKGGQIDFSVKDTGYCGTLFSTAEFPEELIVVISNVKNIKPEVENDAR